MKNEKLPTNFMTRLLRSLEWLGNLLPHPVTLFALFCLLVIFASAFAEWMGLSVIDPRPEGVPGRSEDGMIRPVSLLNAQGLRMMVEQLVTNFTNFAPLGTVLVALLGVGVAEHSGLLKSTIRFIVLRSLKLTPRYSNSTDLRGFRKIHNEFKRKIASILTPKVLVTTAIVFAGILSNTASELGYVVLVPLGAIVFHSLGRHPLAGLAAAFAGVSGGYSANLLLGTIDPLLAGLTQEAARIIDPDYVVHAAVNYYFMFVSVFVITLIGTLTTLFIVEPMLGKYDPQFADVDLKKQAPQLEELSGTETRALLWAFVTGAFLALLLFLAVYPENGILRDPDAHHFPQNIAPFLNGIVAFIFIGFIIPGIVYGKLVGSIKSDRDVIDGMAQAMSTLGLYIVIVFFAAQFVAYFGWTRLGQIVAVSGAQILEGLNLTGPLVFIGFILVSGFINLMLGSASAQWAVTAPIFVPMLMLVGYSPEVIQAAYRIGDSVTNLVTPMMSYFGLILAFAGRYDKRTGIGTIMSMMLPYSVFFLLGWMALFYLMIFGLSIPPGPATEIYYSIGQ